MTRVETDSTINKVSGIAILAATITFAPIAYRNWGTPGAVMYVIIGTLGAYVAYNR